MNRIGKTALIVAANLLILAALVALPEVIARLMIGKPVHGFRSSWRLNHTFEPGGREEYREHIRLNPDFPNPYTRYFNRQAWPESVDVAMRKPRGIYRIFYVGDSFVAGSCPEDMTLPSNVRKMFNRDRGKSGQRIEVINAGTNSYSPILYYVLIRYVICDFQPDLIVVSVDMTDDYDDWKYKQSAVFDGDGNPVAVPPRDYFLSPFIDAGEGAVKATFLGRFQCYLYQNSSFYNLIRNSIRLGAGKAPGGTRSGNTAAEVTIADKSIKAYLYRQWQWCREPWDSATTAQVRITLDYIRRICEFCHGKGIKLMITSVPHYEQYNGNPQGTGKPGFSARPHNEIAGVAAQCGVPYHNAFEDLKPLITGTPQTHYYYAGDMHFNPRGDRIWADAQYRFLTDSANHLLPAGFY